MDTINLYVRKTSKYADGWSHLDEQQYVGTVMVTPYKQVREGNDYDDGGTYIRHARLAARADWKLLTKALKDTMGGSNCRHEYDCCGCARHSVKVERHGRTAVIFTSISYNY